jgi:hypothetical protein
VTDETEQHSAMHIAEFCDDQGKSCLLRAEAVPVPQAQWLISGHHQKWRPQIVQ